MDRSSQRGIFSALVLGACLAVGAVAAAAGDDRATTEALLKDIDLSPKKAIAAEVVARSRAALERGVRMRAAGDEAHARLADSAARTWAESARDLVRTAAVEESAANARRGASDAGAAADRERALLEEAIAQSGRLRAQMESNDGAKDPARTSTAANSAAKPSARDGGAPAPKSSAEPRTGRDGRMGAGEDAKSGGRDGGAR